MHNGDQRKTALLEGNIFNLQTFNDKINCDKLCGLLKNNVRIISD